MKRLIFVSVAFVMLGLLGLSVHARKDSTQKSPANYQRHVYNPGSDRPLDPGRIQINAVVDTYVVARFNFDGPSNSDPQGWFAVDVTEQPGLYFHIDDFDALNGGDFGGLVPLQGDQSLWCGARPDAGDELLCNYATLPGYGNGWDQRFESVEFSHISSVTVACEVSYDSEPGYDYTYLQYQNKNDEWNTILTLDGEGGMTVSEIIPADSLDGSVKIRFQFQSDGAWSDEDGLWNTDGAVIIDQLTVSDASGVLDYQDFETEATGETSTADGDWEASVKQGYGIYAALFHGQTVLQEDPCKYNVSFMWGFFNGSTYDYSCGGHPEQMVVPYVNERGQYFNNEIWSPPFDWHHDIYGTPIPSSAMEARYNFDVYCNLPIPALVAFYWHVRSWIGGCPGDWRDLAFCEFNPGPEWARYEWLIGDLVIPGIEQLQLALTAFDMCPIWCDVYGNGDCHSHSPLFDNVEVLRIQKNGPQWSVRDIDLFQDTFPENGTSIGTGRIDMANDRLPSANPSILPGDSAKVTVSDPLYGLRQPEPYTGFGSAVYFYMSRDPQSKAMPMDKIVEDSFRWPLVDSLTCNNKNWYQFRMDTCFARPSREFSLYDAFCIDINDHYFTNGDTIWFFFGAENAVGEWTFWSQDEGMAGAIERACSAPIEMQILPGEGVTHGGDILYVDNFSSRGAQPYFDSAFQMMGIYDEVDRFDKRGPSSLVGNALGYHATTTQLHDNYRKILWNSGDLSAGTVEDGVYDKADSYALLYAFLDLHPNTNGCGIYFSGDDLASELNAMATGGSQNFKNIYMPHTLVTGDVASLAGHGISPKGIGVLGGTGTPPANGIFNHHVPYGVDTVVVYGGCPIINDFDVIAPVGNATAEMLYDNDPAAPAITAYAVNNSNGYRAATVLSGFSFHYMYDDRPAGVPDRADHLTDIIRYLGNPLDGPVGVTPGSGFKNSLSQNYPNPFNPSTSIKYSVKNNAHVSLKIYNVAGQLVRTLVDSEKNAGAYTEAWNGRSNSGNPVASGVYFYKLVTKDFSKTKKMVILK